MIQMQDIRLDPDLKDGVCAYNKIKRNNSFTLETIVSVTTVIDFVRLTPLLVEAATRGSFTVNKDNDFWNFDGRTFIRTYLYSH